jgi:hypothetical protein
MKIYFFSKKNEEAENINPVQQKIMEYFRQNGVLVLSNLSELTLDTSKLSFENMNGLVIEGQDSVADAGYLIALALTQSKTVMYLLPKGTALPDQLKALQEDKKLKRYFLLKFYNDKNLETHLQDFIDLTESGELRREIPTIKFTLRFTPRVERYLRWKTMGKKVSKADYLRQLVDEAIKNDESYQSFLRKDNEKKETEESTEKDEIII